MTRSHAYSRQRRLERAAEAQRKQLLTEQEAILAEAVAQEERIARDKARAERRRIEAAMPPIQGRRELDAILASAGWMNPVDIYRGTVPVPESYSHKQVPASRPTPLIAA